MSDIKLFRISGNAATEIQGTASHLEKPLQSLIEANLEPLLGIRFVASEHYTDEIHGGRIDSLGLDENNSPVIIEYKRSIGESVMSQGLYYFDWLMTHRADFQLLVQERFGPALGAAIDWDSPRVICIAADFTKYDAHAVKHMKCSLELIRYRHFGKDIMLLELVNAVAPRRANSKKTAKGAKGSGADKPVADWLADLTLPMRELFDSLDGYLTSLGDDVLRKDLKLYIAFKRLRNFATVCFHKNKLLVYLNVAPARVNLVKGYTRDVRKIGHWGTGKVEVTLKNLADLDKAKPLLLQAYEGGSHAG